MSGKRLRNVLLTSGAILGTLCLLLAVAGVLFGIKPLMFRSGSMAPAIPTGGLALSVPVDGNEVRVGDIVSIENTAGMRVTHRVVAVAPADGYAELTLRGDANDLVDAESYAVTTVDRVFWSAPLLGYGVAWLTSTPALFLSGLLTAYLLYIAFRRDPEQSRGSASDADVTSPLSGRRARRRRRGGRRSAVRRMAGVAFCGGAMILSGGTISGGTPAWAQFTDSATATGNVAAGGLSTPGGPTCQVRSNLSTLGYEIVLRWSYTGAVPAAGYDVSVNKGTWSYRTSTSIILPASNAEVDVVARLEAWRSQTLAVQIEYTPGSLTSNPTCAVR